MPSLLALVLLVLLGACDLGGPDPEKEPEELAVGEVVEGSAVLSEVSGGIEVRLPSGPAHFVVDDDLRAVPEDEIPGQLAALPAAADARVLRVAWGRDFLGYGSDVMQLMTGSESEDRGQEVELAVVADGRRTEVPEVGRLRGIGDPDHVYVGIPRNASDVELEVTYDGVTQRADIGTGEVDAGRAAGLYDVPLAAERAIGDGAARCPVDGRRRPGLDVSFACDVLDSWQVPYLDGLGWAGAGQRWLVADASTTLMSLWWTQGERATHYRTRVRAWEVLADSSRPVATLPRRFGNRAEDKRVAFAVEPRERHRLEFRVTYVARPDGELVTGAPPRPTLRLVGAVRVPAAARDR